jgi:hypothetical protein
VNVNSPLGQYAQITAVIVVLATIGAYLVALLAGNPAGSDLTVPASLAFGAVLGSAATVNGYKRDQIATNARLDAIGAPPAAAVVPPAPPATPA